MKSMRDRYFEDFEKVQTPADNRRGFRTEYRYKGFWYSWDLEDAALSREKWRFGITEAVSILALLLAATRRVQLNSVRLAAGLAALAVIPWIAEIWGVFRFATAKRRMMAGDFNEIKNCITVGGSVHAVLLVIAMAAGVGTLISRGALTGADAAVCAGHLFSAAASVFTVRRYASLPYDEKKQKEKQQL